jgi:heme A synthase
VSGRGNTIRPELKTIEFSHRLTTMIAGIVVLVLLIWAFRKFKKGHIVRKLAALSFVFILIEGAIGGGLVLTGNTAANWTPSRPFWTAGHLINTFILIALLALTAWFGGNEKTGRRKLKTRETVLMGIGIASTIRIMGRWRPLRRCSSASSVAEGFARI